ncbi:DUF2955 domain-containing protein [Cobetia amphilecti]|uniref:DUF2955 domain-containing protein n=1 Tax=Cobetia amphilecti TaxID=1055104 RepID=A0ABT6UPL9_9GAMM|nr:DUF2955 domain-containing protein [Cobetia amphilecti]MDI5884651.1 DUF2955 domain-containing protein [Cobetia amphilecti]WOI25201.1 DUF2955 domain-containing protein [Cobetia amphilecti]|tara:strand:+ start:1089 stop:2192 length:1104 start_codon:yes stop_codon:yes gene_type:complete
MLANALRDRLSRLWTRGETLPRVEGSEPRLSENDVQQCLRIAFGGTLGFVLLKWMDWTYGTFFVVNPILLLALVPVLNASIARQFLASVFLNNAFTLVVQGLFGDNPAIMLLLVLGMQLVLFNCMSRGPLFLFGALSVVGMHVQLNFASYPSTDISDLVWCNFVGGGTTLSIVAMMHYCFPDKAPRQPPSRPAKPPSNRRHEVLLTTAVAMVVYVMFQVLDLSDSLSAQIASILILFPMNWFGAIQASIRRAAGTLVGCNVAVALQLVLMTHYSLLWLVALGLWLSLMLFARHHVMERVGSGAGLGAMTTMAILFGQYMSPDKDLIYSSLYRTSSVLVAVCSAMLLIYLMHALLNRFAATRLIRSAA